jgi:serine carboxypeptidase-like clade 2
MVESSDDDNINESRFGLKVGNPYLDDNINNKGKIDFFWTHGVMSDEVYANVTKHCNFDSAVETPSSEAACNDAFDVFDKGEIDSYNIYAPVCLEGPNGKYYPSSNVRQPHSCFLFFFLTTSILFGAN